MAVRKFELSAVKRQAADQSAWMVNSDWFAPAVLLAVALVTYGLLLPRLGFYWDDWAKLLVGRLFGLGNYINYYAEDRPLSAWTHILFTPLLGFRPLGWQMLELLLRWLTTWGFFACLMQIWPTARRQNLAAALIFLVYPAFIQQPAAVTFFQQFIQYALYFFSLYAMLKSAMAAAQAAGSRMWAWMAAGLAAMLLQLSVTEYFVPVELVRPLILWLLLANAAAGQPETFKQRALKQRTLRVLKHWAPYLVVLVAFTLWRLFFIRLPGADPYKANTLYDFMADPAGTLTRLFEIIRIDAGHILFGAWTNLLQGHLFAEMVNFDIMSYGLGFALAWVLGMALVRAAEPDENGRSRWMKQALAVGLVVVLLGPIPAWIIGRQVVFDFHSDRYALPALFGASMVWAAVLDWVAQKSVQRAVLVGLLLTFAIALQVRAANEYRWNWTAQQRLYWQLAWRAPGLQPGTSLVFETEPVENQGLFSTSAAVNLLYPQPAGSPVDPKTNEPLLGYWVYTLTPRYSEAPKSFDINVSTQFRSLKYVGNLSNSLLLFNDSHIANCLWVLDERDADHPRLPELVKQFVPISDTRRILAQGTEGYPAADMFGPEPEHTWCYYFEKADLARQYQDWGEVVRLGDEAQSRGYRPGKTSSNSPHEWMPFIEGYASTNQWDQAAKLTTAAFEVDPRYGQKLCSLWAAFKPEDDQVRQEVTSALGCKP